MKPYQILLCILATFAVLAAVCAVGAGRSELVRVPSIESFLPDLPSPTIPDTLLADNDLPIDTIVAIADTLPAEPVEQPKVDTTPAKPKVVELPQSLPQTTLYLPHFYTALGKAGEQSVRIVHFGDSQIEEDRITMIIRRRLQDRFGGGGIGLVPMVQTIPTYTARQTLEQDGHEVPNSTIRRYLSYGPSSMRLKDDNRYGPMAQVAYITEPIDVNIELLRDRVPTYDYSRIRVLCSDSVLVTLVSDSAAINSGVPKELGSNGVQSSEASNATQSLKHAVINSEAQRSSTLHFEGTGYVYGISLETPTGVQVDNIPMRGAAGTNFTMMNKQMFADYFHQTNTTLIIMQFGGNAMPSIRTQAALEKYVLALRQQIRFLMSAAPNASLLFIGPSDMITTVDGEQRTYPLLPVLDSALATMVGEHGGAYYSLFRLLGGAGSMVSWRDKGLAGDDMIHFTRAGAKKVGEMLAKQLLEDYDFFTESLQQEIQDTIAQSPNEQINELMVNDQIVND